MNGSLTKTPSRSDSWDKSKLYRWENSFDSKTIFVNKGKKNKHSLQILASLALLGPSTTREIAKFVINQSENYPYRKPRNVDSRSIEQMFLRLIDGRESKSTGKRKLLEKYPGLESNYYIRKVGTEEKRNSNLYTLTLNGFLFALGFDFKKDDFKKFLNNAAKHHIFFAYINKISETTSIPFIKKIFLDPIKEIIIKNRMSLDDDISFYFSNIVESIGRKFEIITETVHGFVDDEEDVERRQRVREILRWTFYDDRATSDWYNAMVDVFYPNQNEQDFFRIYSHKGSEQNLIYKIMQKIHFTFFGFQGSIIPIKAQKIPYSKQWFEFKKYNPKFKSPSDYDKKRKIMIKYDANHVPDLSP